MTENEWAADVAALRRLAAADLYDCSADDGDGRVDEWESDRRAADKARLGPLADRIERAMKPQDAARPLAESP